MKKRLAFTLGEILIALGVIGVVASLVIPQIVSAHKTTEARAQFNSAYAMITKAIDDMEIDNVPVLPSKYTTSRSFYPVFKNYFKILKDCGDGSSAPTDTSICPSSINVFDTYTTFSKIHNKKASLLNMMNGSFVTTNGMLILLGNNGAVENPNTGETTINPIYITVDINGKDKKPNKWGWDLFTFELNGNGVSPEGAEGTNFSSTADRYCSENDNTNFNGITCAIRALGDENYFNEIYQGH